MSKLYEFICPKHGLLKIEVEKPPRLHSTRVYCPWCAERLVPPVKVEEPRKVAVGDMVMGVASG